MMADAQIDWIRVASCGARASGAACVRTTYGKEGAHLGGCPKDAAAQAEAERHHLAGVIAVVDDGGWPILLLRMDNAAYIASVELAPGKARTAALFKKSSEALEQAINHGRIAAVTARGFIEMQGGLPIVVDGRVIGGIGASFDTPEHDAQIAQAGLAALTVK
jgi:glc operon protein GlcG